MSANEKVCPNCGREYGSVNRFCPLCGTALIDRSAWLEEKRREEERTKEIERKNQIYDNIKTLFDANKEILEKVGYDRYSFSSSWSSSGTLDRLKGILRYLVFYQTTQQAVAKEFETRLIEIKKGYNKPLFVKAIGELKNANDRRGHDNRDEYRNLFAGLENDLVILDCYFNGGDFISQNEVRESGYSSYRIYIQTEKYRYQGSALQRISNRIAMSKEKKKAGLYAYYMNRELDSIERYLNLMNEVYSEVVKPKYDLAKLNILKEYEYSVSCNAFSSPRKEIKTYTYNFESNIKDASWTRYFKISMESLPNAELIDRTKKDIGYLDKKW